MEPSRMSWNKLLSDDRLGQRESSSTDPERSPFWQDYDRILFSSPFRRLGKKTQVHPLNNNDHIHTRLTHSLEVASVGRSLGIKCGHFLQEKDELPGNCIPEHLGQIVQAACLGHDIGNPPFGHAGEEAIRSWFSQPSQANMISSLTLDEKNDFLFFDGNAQGFRLLARTEFHRNDGGMRLTYATLATMLKYPWSSTIANITHGKFCAFQSEKDLLDEIATHVGLIKCNEHKFSRHPLAFLVEAADDICYRILDIEDAHEMEILAFDDVVDILKPLCNNDNSYMNTINGNMSPRRKISYIRAKSINTAIKSVFRGFKTHYDEIMSGTFDKELISCCPDDIRNSLDRAKQTGKDKIFNEHRKIELEIGCYSTIGILLDALCTGAVEKCFSRGQTNYKTSRVIKLLSRDTPLEVNDLLESLHIAADYLSGMTDNYATHLAKQLGGMPQ